MDARDRLWSMLWDNYTPEQKNAALDDHTAEVMREVAQLIEERFPDPNPLSSIFQPYIGDKIVTALRQEADNRRRN